VEVQISGGYDYASQITVATDDDKLFRAIRFPKELKPQVGFRRCAFKEDDYWFVPGDTVVATALGQGDTYQASLDSAGRVAREIQCNNIYFDGDFIREMNKTVEKLNTLGKDFAFGGPSTAPPAKNASDLLNFGPRHQRSRMFKVQSSRFKVR
jgi:hypothetical protein